MMGERLPRCDSLGNNHRNMGVYTNRPLEVGVLRGAGASTGHVGPRGVHVRRKKNMAPVVESGRGILGEESSLDA